MGGDAFNIPMIAAGLVVGLFGWVLYWAGIPLVGGVVGACAGGALGILAADFVQASWGLPLFLGIGITLGAIMGVMLMRAIQLYFFFTTGAILGGALAWRLIQRGVFEGLAAGTPGWGVMLAVVIGALAGGVLMLFLRRFIIALITSVAGVLLVIQGLPPRYQFIGGLISLVIFLAAQVGLVHRFVEREAFDQRMRRYNRRERPPVDTVE